MEKAYYIVLVALAIVGLLMKAEATGNVVLCVWVCFATLFTIIVIIIEKIFIPNK